MAGVNWPGIPPATNPPKLPGMPSAAPNPPKLPGLTRPTPPPAPAPWSASQRADHERTATRARNAELKKKAPPAPPAPPRPPARQSKAGTTGISRFGGDSQFGPDTPWARAVANFNATPDTPEDYSGSSATSSPEIKAATPDLIQITEEGMSSEVIADLLFEDIGGTEILNIARHDLINGIDIKYQQISNLSKVESSFGGNTLINIQNPIEQIFNKFALKRYQYIPETTDDPSGLDNHVYLDASGSLNIELINLAENMQVEIEFKTATTTDIIY